MSPLWLLTSYYELLLECSFFPETLEWALKRGWWQPQQITFIRSKQWIIKIRNNERDSTTSSLTKRFVRPLCLFWHVTKNVLHTIMTNDTILLITIWLSFFACRVFVGQRRPTTRRGFGTTTPLNTWSSGRSSASLRKSTSMTWTTTCPPLTCRLTAENVSDSFAPGDIPALETWQFNNKEKSVCLKTRQ